MFTGLRSDFAAAARSLFKSPAYSLFSILCLALGIGATTAVFTVFNTFLLRPLPFQEPDRLMAIWMTVHGADPDTRYFVAAAEFTELQEISEGFELAGVQPVNLNLSRDGEPQPVEGTYATANLFDVVGLEPLQGRFFSLDEERAGQRVCLISEELWRDRLGAADDVLSRPISLNGIDFLVVGVAQARSYPDRAQVWIPVTEAVRTGRNGLTAVARLNPGVSLAAALQELERSTRYFQERDPVSNGARRLMGGALNDSINDPRLDDNLWALLGVVGFLLAIACANIASLLMVRLQQQRPELAVRAALGAGRGRLLRRVLVESGLVSAVGAAGGLALAAAATPALVALSPAQLPRFRTIGLDVRVLGFAAALAVVTLLIFSVVPAWRAASRNPAARLASAGRGSSTSLSRFQRGLAVADVALALILIAGAGLMLTSFLRLHGTSPGFEPDRLFRAKMVAPASRSDSPEARVAFALEVERELTSVAGVERVGATHSYPVGGFQYWISFLLEDRPEQSADEAELGIFQIVTPGYFDVMGLRPMQGRILKPEDREGAGRVVVVSAAFARQYWPDSDPLGQRLRPARATSADAWWEIVGVVPDQKDRGLAREIGPSIYFPLPQFARDYTKRMDLFVRSAGIDGMAAAISRGIRAVEPDAVVYEVEAMEDVLAETLQRERFSAVLTAILAGLAVTLAGAGIYGVISYGVRQRRAEMGVRMAFGARGADLKRLVVGHSLKGVLIGVVVGNAAVLVLGRLVSSQLYETAPHDPVTLAGASAVIVATALLASYLPARRTAQLDPTEALRE